MQTSLRDTASARTGSWKTLDFWKQQPYRMDIGTGFDVETKDAYRSSIVLHIFSSLVVRFAVVWPSG